MLYNISCFSCQHVMPRRWEGPCLTLFLRQDRWDKNSDGDSGTVGGVEQELENKQDSICDENLVVIGGGWWDRHAQISSAWHLCLLTIICV